MISASESAVGIELVSRDPNNGENELWVSCESYEAATPTQWDNVPISYLRRMGNNKLVVSRESYSGSLLEDISCQSVEEISDSQTALSPVDIHIRTDGLYVWSASSSKGIRVPIEAIATHAPDRVDSDEALRLDMIPEQETDDDGFVDSILYHIVVQTLAADADIPEIRRDTAANYGPAVQAMLKAVTDCQDHLPPTDEEPNPALFGGVSAYTAGLQGVTQDSSEDVVRIAGLENFSGWVTSENIEEVMRAQGLSNGNAAGVGQENAEQESLGPGAGSRRPRDDDAAADTNERITIWQRTEDH